MTWRDEPRNLPTIYLSMDRLRGSTLPGDQLRDWVLSVIGGLYKENTESKTLDDLTNNDSIRKLCKNKYMIVL